MATKTVSTQWLKIAARRLQLEAEECLPVWALLGQTGRYDENMKNAALLLRAAGIKNIGERREFLRGHGIEA